MLQVINNNTIRTSPRLSFGSQDTPIMDPGAIASPQVSNNPYEERHGYIKNDVYGLKSSNADMKPVLTRPMMDMYPGLTDMHDGEKSRTPGSTVKSILPTALLIGAGTLAIMKRKQLGNFYKNVFKKGAKQIDSPKEIKSIEAFNKYHTSMTDATNNDKIDSVKIPEKIKIILKGKNESEKKALLEKAYDIADTSARKEIQPKIIVQMTNEMEGRADEILDLIKEGKISDLDNDALKGITGFNIEKTPHSRDEIAVAKQIRYGKNVDSVGDRSASFFRRIVEALRLP